VSLIAPGGSPPTQLWDHALAEPNLEDALIDHALDRLVGIPGLSRVEAAYRKRLRHKSWQYMTAVSDDVFVAFIVGTAGFASNGFVYALERATGRVHECFAIAPGSVGTQLAPSSTAGVHRFANRKLSVTIHNRDRDFDADITAPDIEAQLAFTSAPADQHFSVCVPLGGNRWNYTHKFGAFAIDGHITLAGKRFSMTGGFGTLDFTKSYALRHAVWKWIALAGKSRGGAVVGINLVDPTPAAPVSENCAWVDGERIPLTDVQLQGDATSWRVRASGLDLSVRPVGQVEQRLDVPLIRHRLTHVIGSFTGTLTVGRTRHELDNIVGIAEDNDTWW
jgi:hypothetical protein